MLSHDAYVLITWYVYVFNACMNLLKHRCDYTCAQCCVLGVLQDHPGCLWPGTSPHKPLELCPLSASSQLSETRLPYCCHWEYRCVSLCPAVDMDSGDPNSGLDTDNKQALRYLKHPQALTITHVFEFLCVQGVCI